MGNERGDGGHWTEGLSVESHGGSCCSMGAPFYLCAATAPSSTRPVSKAQGSTHRTYTHTEKISLLYANAELRFDHGRGMFADSLSPARSIDLHIDWLWPVYYLFIDFRQLSFRYRSL